MKYDNKEIIHKKIGDMEILQFKALLKYEKYIEHCFTLRHGGFSSQSFNSLNLGLNTNDDMDIVKHNYKKVCDTLGFKYNNLFRGVQVHSNNIVFVDNMNCGVLLDNRCIECDGGITNVPQIPLVTNGADCMTVLIYDNTNKYIASIHSGWQGVLNAIVIKGIRRLVNEHICSLDNLIVCVCPSICKDCFEVMSDVKELFEREYNYSDIITKKDNEHFLINLQELLYRELLITGIKEENIHFSRICNKCNCEDFYSFRNDKNTGRMGCFIMLK